MTILPAEILSHARALLEARHLRRPAQSLPFLVQQILRWRTALKGAPGFEPSALRLLVRDFRELGFDALPGGNQRWNQDQRAQAETLFLELAPLVAMAPPLDLPAFPEHPKPSDRLKLVDWLWNHIDYCGAALTMGLLGSGVLATDPADPRFHQQAELRDRIVQLAGALVPFTAYLGGPSGAEMTLEQALRTASSLLDGLAACIDEAFALGGPRGAWLIKSGGWCRPVYPCFVRDGLP